MSQSTVWVGNLPNGFNDGSLADLFTSFGAISSAKVMDSAEGSCGLVEFADPASAQSAIDRMNGYQVLDQALVCQFARRAGGEDNNDEELPSYEQVSSGMNASTGPPRFDCNIWIGNLPQQFSENELQSFCAVYGTVSSVKIIAGRAGDNAGLVNFSTHEEAQRAIAGIDGQQIVGSTKPLIAKLSQPSRKPRGAQPPSYPAPYGTGRFNSRPVTPQSSAITNCCNVWVGNIPAHYQTEDLNKLFASFGNIVSSKIILDKSTRHSTGACFVMFSTPGEAQAAMDAYNGITLPGETNPMVLKKAVSNPRGFNATQAASPAYPSYGQSTPDPSNYGAPREQQGWDHGGSADERFTNLWVGNLPLTLQESDLHNIFAACGDVLSVKIIRRQNNPASRSTGAGLVNFKFYSQAAAAMKVMEGKLLPGAEKGLVIKPSSSRGRTIEQPIPPHSDMVESLPSYGQHAPPPSNRSTFANSIRSSNVGGMAEAPARPVPFSESLWVGNLPIEFSEAELTTLFSPYGQLQQTTVLRNKETGQSLGAGLVRYGTVAQAVQAVSGLNGYALDPNNNPLVVKFSGSSGGRAPDVRDARDARDVRSQGPQPPVRYRPY